MNSDPDAAALVIRSLCSRRTTSSSPASKAARNELMRALFPHLVEGGVKLQTFLISLGVEKRHLLLQSVVPELRLRLAASVGGLDDGVSPPQLEVFLPASDQLPDDIARGLAGYFDKIQRRLGLLVQNGHSRDPTYLRRKMSEPIRLARFLAAHGITRCAEISSSVLVKYAKQYPGYEPRKLAPFLAHIRSEDHFRKKASPKSKKKPVQILRSARVPDVYQPEELTQKLREARRRLTAEEYVLYWMVARLGMTAKAAAQLSLSCLHINTEGQMVIRPATGWVNVPKSVAGTLRTLATSAAPGWPFDEPAKGAGIPFLSPVASPEKLASTICERESKKLRLSAAYAAIRAGHHDRSTLKAFMGISLPILERLEFLMSADLHMVVDPDIVNARNAVIMGEADG